MPADFDLTRQSGAPTVGVHTFRVDRVQEKEGDSGYAYFGLSCVCQDQGEDQGKEVYHILSLSPAARFKMDEFLDAIGAPKKGKGTVSTFQGKVFRGDVIMDEYEGTKKAAFKKTFPASSQKEMPLPSQPVTGSGADEEAPF